MAARNLHDVETNSSSDESSTCKGEGGIHDNDGGPEDFDEDTPSLTIVQFVIDCNALAKNPDLDKSVIYSRFTISLGLYILTLVAQIALLHWTKEFVCAQAVHDIRNVYDKYESVMYSPGGNISSMTAAKFDECFYMTVNKKHRGKNADVCFHAENFKSSPLMTDEEKATACRIPLSQPHFIATVLFLWTVTCLAELKKTWKSFICVVWNTNVINTMATCFEGHYADKVEEGRVIHGLTRTMKSIVLIFCIFPRIVITCYLLWVGCRWLLATDGFADLILNAVALEFILMIKEMLYMAMVPKRNRTDRDLTKTLPESEKYSASQVQLCEVCFWLGIGIGWVLLYMHYFQQVLPRYNWDVRAVCAKWIDERYAV